MNVRMKWDGDRVVQLILDAPEGLSSADLRGIRFQRAPTEPVPILSRPDGTDPQGHAERVAHAYRIALQHSHRPCVLLAQAAGVPVGTVRGWVHEARRKGAL